MKGYIYVFISCLLISPIINAQGANPIDFSVASTTQEKLKITGTVVDQAGEPLPGANVVEKGTTNGSVTDVDGTFSMIAPSHSILVVSYVGFTTQEIPVNNQLYLRIELAEDGLTLENVVVTALGIARNESELTYSLKQVGGDELTRVKDANLMNSLAGKVAGMQVNKTSSGLGASSRVVLRGIRSVAGNNQPLYVVDGIPILNSSNEQASTAVGGTADAGNRDGGDGISNLNPEDIASISVLKGAPAAALYGSQAANGVILITTKSGRSDQRKITFTSNLTFDQAFALPEFQNSYGTSDGIYSWGEKANLPAYDHASDFFETGVLAINALSVSSGNERYQTYFSYANTTGKGITDNNNIAKHNLNFRETAFLFDQRLKLDGNVTLFRQELKNRNPVGGFYMNPLVGLYRFPRGMDMTEYREHFEVWDDTRNLGVQNWHSDIQDFEQNPYWVLNRIKSKDVRTRATASVAAELIVNSWFRLKARGSMDNSNDRVRQQFYASTAPALSGENGRYVEMTYEETMFYGDILGTFNKKFNDFSLSGAIGASINDKTVNSLRYDSKTASLKYPNVFNIANINMNGSAYISQQIDARRQMQSVFGTAQLGYRESLFMDLTARNDWSSTLAFTPHEKSGFFYPSVGGSWVIHKMVDLPEWISFSKIRGVWSKVGNDIPLYITNPVAHVSAGGEIESVDAAPFEEMKPEMTTSVELGTEWKFLDNRINLGITWYKTNTRNQFFKLAAKSGDKYAYRYVNAGDIQNKGWEINLSAFPIIRDNLSWRTEWNFSSNRNKVIKLHEELPVFVYGPQGFSSSYAMKLREGGSFGDIYGKAFVRDAAGQIVYETEGEKAGLPQVEGDGNLIKVGNANAKFNLSWGNQLNYKQLRLSLLIDSRFGGEVLSQTFADMDMYGVTKATAAARDRGYVDLEGHRIDNVEGFYRNIVGGRAGVTEYYMYDATNIRLRELSLGYSLPRKWVEAAKVFQDVELSFVGRNLFFLYKKAPFDPELVLSTGNDNQGIEVYGMPTTRTLGFNIKCEF
ncbi:SusC/RagA family TonB-linked outer membrane protein [Parabacteroides sp. PF5-6]|uniref:SusC/RagA family TonB-linked outer membrane protein n=1 Tax=Parabacteroides sp. PF5-6 TaxID=1742403 RepID=UPI002404BE7D|nr:SusC/RagA family TonB-linked outer membrane protein [Parabacteroides sp. PF5-6]MDF9830983.1 TonB-linked SusC/RagA family outer membrane protein [Parabacteroides sp. PF5-6]